MTQDWGQKSVRWPSPWPWAMIAALAVGVAAFAGAGVWHYLRFYKQHAPAHLGDWRLLGGILRVTHRPVRRLPHLPINQRPEPDSVGAIQG